MKSKQTEKLIKSLKVANLQKKLEELVTEQKSSETQISKEKVSKEVYVRLEDCTKDHLDSGRLRKLFRRYGKIVDIRYKTEFSFVCFETIEQAAKAVVNLNLTRFGSTTLIVELAIPKEPIELLKCWRCGYQGHIAIECAKTADQN